MKKRTVRLILDCMICDAMSPEFKKANDILLRIIKTNDRTGGIEYTRLSEINKAFKANDPKAAKVAFDKLASNIAKGEKRLQDELNEAKSKLAETTKAFDTAKAALAQQKPLSTMFDKFVKAIDAAKANPKGVSKLNAYADKLTAFGDFSKRIMQIQQMATAKKDISKQCDMLKKAVEAGKAKHAKAMKKAEDDLAKAKDRVAVFKEMDKIRTKKIAEFAKEKEDVQKLGQAIPDNPPGSASNVSTVVTETPAKTGRDYISEAVAGIKEEANAIPKSNQDIARRLFVVASFLVARDIRKAEEVINSIRAWRGSLLGKSTTKHIEEAKDWIRWLKEKLGYDED